MVDKFLQQSKAKQSKAKLVFAAHTQTPDPHRFFQLLFCFFTFPGFLANLKTKKIVASSTPPSLCVRVICMSDCYFKPNVLKLVGELWIMQCPCVFLRFEAKTLFFQCFWIKLPVYGPQARRILGRVLKSRSRRCVLAGLEIALLVGRWRRGSVFFFFW